MISLWIGILLLILLAVAGVTIFILAVLCSRLQRQIDNEREDQRDEDHVPAAGKQHSHGGRR